MRLRRYPVLRNVIVNTRSDKAFRGVIWQKRREYLVLRNAELIKAGGETVPIEGDLVIPGDNVDFVQVIP